jgi:hydrogenase nickel incorporation protein HypA/HybF
VHEAALCQGLLQLIDEQRKARAFREVRRVIVEIGVLGHVDPHALAFAFEAASPGSVAAGARLEIIEVPGKAWCMDCSELVSLPRRGEACPICGGYAMIVEQGEEMRLKELEVA